MKNNFNDKHDIKLDKTLIILNQLVIYLKFEINS